MNGYRATSLLLDREAGKDLQLATAAGRTPVGLVDSPDFFSGFVARPDVVAAGLLVVADVAATTYFDLAAIRAATLDPVTTASGDRLRWESFSRCNGVYARFDLLSEGIESGDVRFGTTNVDINQPLRVALASVRRAELLHLGVGDESLRFSTVQETHEERRVDLPDRWIRGFAETPKLASEMTLSGEAAGTAAMKFLAALPPGAPGPTMHAVAGPRGLQLAPPAAGGARLAGTARLTSARRLMRFIERMRIFSHASGASAWVFDVPGGRLTLMTTPDPYRGFSGEGAQLTHLAARSGDAVESALQAHLAWQPSIEPASLAASTGLTSTQVVAGLAALATSGKVGFDLAESAWFHRELPMDDERIEKDNPRLASARELVSAAAVQRDGNKWRIGEDDGVHWVDLEPGADRCTCRWYSRYRASRGPCSHILAARIVAGDL